MKKGALVLLVLMLSSAAVSAEVCNINTTLLSQDPYPAVPGDYVKLVFQIKGIDNPDCNDIIFTLPENYPIEFDPGETGIRIFNKVDYIKDYESNILIPYEVRIDKNAVDGANPIEVMAQSRNGPSFLKSFDIEVDDVKADFEVYVKDYDYTTKELTFEILNIAEADVEALTLEIPKQDGLTIKGASRIVVGDLDSNEYTTADFEATPANGDFTVNLIYSDTINVRRTLEKTVNFDSSYFTERAADQTTTSVWTYIIWLAIIVGIIWWIIKRRNKNKKK